MTPQEQEYYESYIREMQTDLQSTKLANSQIQNQAATSMFNSEANDNLVKWQLDIKEELERIEHLLRKHVPKIDENGNEYYEEPDQKEQLFNNKGVNEILNVLAWYLNKNIILSNFSEDQINQRVHQFARYLTNFIFNNYQEFGLDTREKIKHYPMVVMNIVNTIEAAYNRALKGGERESLRTARSVHQTEPIGMNQFQGGHKQAFQPKKFSILKPSTWT